MSPPAAVLDALHTAGQSHVLAAWHELDAAQREALIAQIEVCCASCWRCRHWQPCCAGAVGRRGVLHGRKGYACALHTAVLLQQLVLSSQRLRMPMLMTMP